MFRVGCVVGASVSGVLIKYFGPRKILLYTAIPSALAWLPIIFATSAIELCTGRFFFGLFCSLGTPAVVVYTAEITSPHIRGILLTVGFILMTFGILFGYAVGYLLWWDTQAIVYSVIPLILLTLFLFPESPRWLITNKKPDEAKRALLKLRNQRHYIGQELEEITNNVTKTKEEKLKELLKKKYVKPIIVVIFSTYFLDFNGYFFMSSFMVIIFQESGGMVMEETLATVLFGIFQFVGVIISAGAIDKYGRRVLLMTSLLVMGLTQSALALYYYLLFSVPSVNMSNFTWMPLLAALLTGLFFILGIGNIHWVLCGELFPVKIRSVVAGFAVSWNSVLMFVMLQSFFFLKRLLTLPGLFAYASINCFFGVAFIYKCLPETWNIPLEEIETLWK